MTQPGSYGPPPAQRTVKVRRYNQRMAARAARRAKVSEPAVAVAFTFSSLGAMLLFGLLEQIAEAVPTVGEALKLVVELFSFRWHRTVLVTETHVYIYRDLPFHRIGAQLGVYERGPGVVTLGNGGFIRRGQLTFQDGTIVFHGIFFIKRVMYVAQEANIPAGM